MMCHLYELVISNRRVWLKLQASCSSSEQASAFFEYRFNGTEYTTADGHRPVTPFKLSQRSHFIANWESIVERLPAGWDEYEFNIVGTPYPWCEDLTDGCDCHGAKGRLDTTHCSDFGLKDETDPKARKTENIRFRNYVRSMEDAIAHRDESQRRNQQDGRQRLLPQDPAPTEKRQAQPRVDDGVVTGAVTRAIHRINQLVAQGFYCSIEGRHHKYSEQVIRKTVARTRAACEQVSMWDRPDPELVLSKIGDLAAYWLTKFQSDECAERSVWGGVDIPDILYKYIPAKRIGEGAPNSLRTTQLLALNDDMECNVITMKGEGYEDTLAFLTRVQLELEEHLGIAVPWDELLQQSLRYGGVRLSTFFQEYLNPRVGVVSFTTDILVPTMWAHYAANTGIVVGYDTETLNSLGFELRPVVYSEIAPMYEPSRGDTIWLDYVDRESVERDLRAGRSRKGTPILTRTRLAELGRGWKSLSRLLLVKGISWAYEKEVRLLVDLARISHTVAEQCSESGVWGGCLVRVG